MSEWLCAASRPAPSTARVHRSRRKELILDSTIADHVQYSAPENRTVLIDAFAGVGGNTIAFALSGRWKQIFAIEKDPAALACAKHNAEVYGVAKKIFWIEGDCMEQMKKRFSTGMKEKAVVFASPPWGGPQYSGDRKSVV